MYFLVLILGPLSFGHAFEELFFVLLFAVELAKTDRTPALSQWDPGSRPPAHTQRGLSRGPVQEQWSTQPNGQCRESC